MRCFRRTVPVSVESHTIHAHTHTHTHTHTHIHTHTQTREEDAFLTSTNTNLSPITKLRKLSSIDVALAGARIAEKAGALVSDLGLAGLVGLAGLAGCDGASGDVGAMVSSA